LIYIKSRTGIPPDEGVPHLRGGGKKKPKRVLHICLNMMMDVNLESIIPRKMEEKKKEQENVEKKKSLGY
jgi:hypothetical protein